MMLTGADWLARIPAPPGVAEHGVVVRGQDGAGVAAKPMNKAVNSELKVGNIPLNVDKLHFK